MREGSHARCLGNPFDRYDTPVDRDEATPCHEARLDRLEAVVDCMNARLNRLERRMRRGMLVLLVGSTAGMTLMVYLTGGGR